MSSTITPGTDRIDGTRTTVYHVMDWYTLGWPPEKIATVLPITVEQVNAAIAFIEANKEHVNARYQVMLDRCARGNPPEIEAKLVKTREKMRKFMEERRARAQNCS